jgi:hypothetical protein
MRINELVNVEVPLTSSSIVINYWFFNDKHLQRSVSYCRKIGVVKPQPDICRLL